MRKHLSGRPRRAGWHRRFGNAVGRHRRLSLEPLEPRQLLAITLTPLVNQTVPAGAPLDVALSATASHPVTYLTSLSNNTLGGANPALTATVR